MTVKISKPPIDEHRNFVPMYTREDTKRLVVHCSATLNKPSFDWKTIDQIHRQQGWLGIGYHFVIKTDGTIQNGRDLGAVGSHAKGFNHDSVGICLIGGVDKNNKPVDNFTEEQKKSLKELLDYLRWFYEDTVTVCGHRDLPNVKKDCPCFDVKSWYRPIKAKYAKYSNTEEFYKTVKISKSDFLAVNGDSIEEGDLVRVA